MKKKGEITVFLVLILSVISAFVILLVTTVRKYVIRSESESAADLAVRSTFAEYNRTLFERFHILLIDSSYKSMDNGIDRIADRFAMYLGNSISKSEVSYIETGSGASALEGNCEYLYDAAVGYARNNPEADHDLSMEGDDAYFLSYLMSVCGYRDDPADGAVRSGEIEYLLYGFDDDRENIRLAESDYEECEDLTYEEFLKSRLEDEGIIQLCRRFGDIVTEYMKSNGSPGFDLGECYHRIEFTARIYSDTAGEYEVTREFAYEDISKQER